MIDSRNLLENVDYAEGESQSVTNFLEIDCKKCGGKIKFKLAIGDIKNVEEYIEHLQEEIEKKEKRISDLEFALMNMVLQFADESKNSINTMGLSALEIAFNELDFDNPMSIKEVHERYKKLAQKYYE